MIGSSGLVVMDDRTYTCDGVARVLYEFYTNESCGKCVPSQGRYEECLKFLNGYE